MTMREFNPAVAALAIAAVLSALLLPRVLAAQQQELMVAGTVLGPDGTPMSAQRVVLHRVDEAGGATIAETESGEDGSFVMSAPATADTSAVYFVAARYEGELYIGAPFRGMDPGATDQLLQVGVPAMSATALLEGADGGMSIPMGRPATSRNWMLFIIPLVGVAGVALFMLLPRQQIPEERRLLIRVAELDERMTTAPRAQRESLQAEREQLMDQLRSR